MALVQVTPENAALWGFDRIGQTINTDTGGIVNPFEGPADGIDGRASRNAAIAARGPGNVAPGYSQIMSDPRNLAFNERLLNDPQFAWSNLQEGFGNQVNGNNPMLFYNGTGPSAPTNPLTSSRTGTSTGTGTNPIGSFRFGTGGTQTTTPPKTDPLTGGPVYNTGGSTGTINANSGGPPLTTTNPTPQETSMPMYSNSTADTGQGLFAVGDPSKTGGSAFQSVPGVQKTTAEYAPGREGVVNAMTKRFDARKWF